MSHLLNSYAYTIPVPTRVLSESVYAPHVRMRIQDILDKDPSILIAGFRPYKRGEAFFTASSGTLIRCASTDASPDEPRLIVEFAYTGPTSFEVTIEQIYHRPKEEVFARVRELNRRPVNFRFAKNGELYLTTIMNVTTASGTFPVPPVLIVE